MARQSALPKESGRARAGAKQEQESNRPRQTVQRQQPKGAGSPAAAADLDRLIHERVRLAIVSALAVNESLTFNELKQLLNTTDGNLSVHARKLEEAEYVVCNKYFDGRTPKTEYRLTAAGRRALEHYLNHMESLIRAARGG
ncbi:MAG TPA: transcriptional regulator [Pyrinomonadaceae bacterium]|nr:transcriptional regulator [Pyrinomonadaceae bacterium]